MFEVDLYVRAKANGRYDRTEAVGAIDVGSDGLSRQVLVHDDLVGHGHDVCADELASELLQPVGKRSQECIAPERPTLVVVAIAVVLDATLQVKEPNTAIDVPEEPLFLAGR